MSIKTEAIVLKSEHYNDQNQIITLFSKQLGILSLMKKTTDRRSIPPLFEGEFTLRKGKNFFYVVDVTQTFHHLEIRQSLESIQIASKMVHYLLKSQFPLKPSPNLYAFFSLCLKKICQMQNIQNLDILFLTKLLMHEGHLPNNHQSIQKIATIRNFQEIEDISIDPKSLELLTDIFNECY